VLPRRERGDPFLRALSGVIAISTGNRAPISMWAVNARH
jgi:hypothetical protein